MSTITNNSAPMETRQGNGDDINGKITKAAEKTQSMSSVYMYRVPQRLRDQKKIAYYTPKLVSIGPLHRDDDHLKLSSYMEDIKMSYMNSLLCRVANGLKKTKLEVLEKCVEKMKELIVRAKECYVEEDVKKLNEEMLLIDGCFILELLFRYRCWSIENRTDPILGNDQMSVTVQQDLLLLENQLPFFVLQKLFKLTLAGIPNLSHSLENYILSFFPDVMNLKRGVDPTNCTSAPHVDQFVISIYSKYKFYHMLHFLHNCCIPAHPKESPPCSSRLIPCLSSWVPWFRPPLNQTHKEDSDIRFTHSASDLEYAGVKFKFVAGTGNELFNIQFTRDQFPLRWFRRACFQMPTLSIYDSTEVVLRNLIAFEQCCPADTSSSYVTSYAFLMDRLINTAKDVEVLQKAGVIRNYLGANEDASDLFNNLCKAVVLRKYCFDKTCKRVDKYCKHIWPAAMAHLRRKYFDSPWTFIAFCAALIAFAATLGNFILNLRKK